MNPARFDELVTKVALAIDRDAVKPNIEARVLARAVVSLVEDRTEQECLVLSAEIGVLLERFPRKAPG